jgi:hypothetical protein
MTYFKIRFPSSSHYTTDLFETFLWSDEPAAPIADQYSHTHHTVNTTSVIGIVIAR